MPLLKYWDVSSGQYLVVQAGAQGPAGPTGPAGPAGPQGPIGSPYFPSQTPPASGFNSFTDTSGMIWVSYNGSAWKRATDALFARVWRNTVYNIPTGQTPMPFDTIDHDSYGLWTPASNFTFTIPLTGIWLVMSQMILNASVSSYLNMSIIQGSNTLHWNGSPTTTGYLPTICAESFLLSAGQTINAQTNASTAAPCVTGQGYTYFSIKYLGTG